MYLSLNWLKDFVDIPKSITPEELGLKLTMHTVEIDSVKKEADKYDLVVVGKIKEIKKHPNADKSQLVKVDIKTEETEVVCGATNISVGNLVPVALVGAVLPNGLEIKPAEIRGIKSNGMLCAADELNLGDDHSGILILADKAKVGQAFGEYLKLGDVIFEVDNKSITNRPDLWGHYGMAREIAAFLGTKFDKKLEGMRLDSLRSDSIDKLKVKVEDFTLCPRYIAVSMEGIEITDSPKWIQARLAAVGVRPINNIVDITNYVMIETGQPLHAFDRKLVDNIVVRPAKEEESIITLDGEERKLKSSDIVIADWKKPIAIAGVMGADNSEIGSETTAIIIESANFNPTAVRKTSQRLGLRSEASQRFEKSLDPNLCETAAARAIELIRKVCPRAKVASRALDEKKFTLDQGPIELDLKWLEAFTGQAILKDKAIDILGRLGFASENGGGEKIKVTVHTRRSTKDVSIKEDLAEEIARLIGYDNLAPAMPQISLEVPEANQEKKLAKEIRIILTGPPAMNEVYNYSFVGEELLKKLGVDYSTHIKLANPISVELTLLRQNLAPRLIENIIINQARFSVINLFEIGNVYLSVTGDIPKIDKGSENLPYQEKRLGLIVAADKTDEVFNRAKGIISHLLEKLGLPVTFTPVETPFNWSDPKAIAQIKTNQTDLGFVYAIAKEVGHKMNIKKPVAVAEISLKQVLDVISTKKTKQFTEFAKYPPAGRDLAFVVEESVLYNDIKEAIVNWHEYVKQAELFDVYRAEKLGKNKKNLAFHVVYQADKTLKNEEVDELQKGLIKKLEERFGAKFRNF